MIAWFLSLNKNTQASVVVALHVVLGVVVVAVLDVLVTAFGIWFLLPAVIACVVWIWCRVRDNIATS